MHFGTNMVKGREFLLTEVITDKYFFTQVEEELIDDETLSNQAKSNTIGNFKYGFENIGRFRFMEG